jgi:hypothetical protein
VCELKGAGGVRDVRKVELLETVNSLINSRLKLKIKNL